ncbi:hypothetical protein DL95DRAFT_90292 [Leptodontidium sp. 2 PMI_412]|nr:hypothetical protein DL95DRAFT_90292 [Leptodontidium sp. 2 PMI_412]
MQHLFTAPGLAFSWRLSLRRGTSTRTKIARCVHSSRPISSAAQSQVSATSREGHRYEVEVERFDVKCGSSGLITVDLYNSNALKNPSNTLIIHLPPTGTHLRHTHPPIPSYLLTPRTALASINFRWNIPSPSASSSKSPPKLLSSNPSYAHHPFPTPLHDTLAGYTFLLSTLLPRFCPQPTSPTTTSTVAKTRQSIYASSSPSPFLPIQRPLLLYGSFLGGTLATSLALTENFTSRSLPTKIVGLITKNAVFNWTDIVTSPSPLTSPPSSSSSFQSQPPSSHQDVNSRDSNWDIQTLHSLKKNLFTNPASAFDSFASPTLFFRTSGLAIPQSWPTADEAEDEGPRANSTYSTHLSLSPSEIEDLWPSEEESLSPSPSQNPTTPISTSNPASQNQDQAPAADLGKHISHLTLSPPTRPADLKYPPKSSTLKIPFSLFLYTPSSSSSPSTSPPPLKPHLKPKPKPNPNPNPKNNTNTNTNTNKPQSNTKTPTPPPTPKPRKWPPCYAGAYSCTSSRIGRCGMRSWMLRGLVRRARRCGDFVFPDLV